MASRHCHHFSLVSDIVAVVAVVVAAVFVVVNLSTSIIAFVHVVVNGYFSLLISDH